MLYRKSGLILIILIVLGGLSIVGAATPEQATGIAFMRVMEPKEEAFSILVPKGWKMEGGIFRVNPLQAGGPINAMEAKCDLIFKSDDQGTVYFRILPDVIYAYPGIGGGFFLTGSSYQGAEIRPLPEVTVYLKNVFGGLHPGINSIKTVKLVRLPGEKESLDQSFAQTNQLLGQVGLPHMAFQTDAAGGVFEYEENGVRFREVMLTGIIDMRAAQTWKNTRTLIFRAPVESFEQWRPVMDVMRFSVRFNPQWILKESQGQSERAQIVQDVYEDVQRIDREIIRKTTINREEIMNDNFLVLTEQEEFVNPHTNEVEVDTGAYKYRWINPGGDIYYTNQEGEDPNHFLQRTDYKRSPIRKRRNE